MLPEVIISNVAKHHAYESAVAAQKVGTLKKFYTSFYLESNPSITHQLLMGLMPKELKRKMTNRFHHELSDILVKSYFFPELIERIKPLRSLLGNYNMMNLKGSFYDLRVSYSDLNCNIFHGFEGAVLYSMRASKKKGAITVLDQPIFYYETLRKILNTEYEYWGVKPPEYLHIDDVNIRRKKAEIKEADYLFVPTEEIAKDFNKLGKKTIVTQYGFNSARFGVGKKQDNVFRILFVGIVGFRKGVIYLLEAFKQLKLNNAELIIISPIDNDFKIILKKYEGIFKHFDFVPNDKIIDFYQNASVFVFPSLVEGSALSNYEAMACGLPVITTSNAGSVVREGTDGFIVEIRNVEAIKEKIAYLYNHEKVRIEMGKNAAEYVKRFTWERYHEYVGNTYLRIAEGGKVNG